MVAITVDAPIDRVTVFRGGARVFRRVTVEVEADGVVRVPNLPLALQDGTLRATVHGDGAPAASQVRIGLEVPAKAEARPVSEVALREARTAMRLLNVEADRVFEVMEALSRVSTPDRAKGRRSEQPMSPTEARLQLLAFRREHLAELRTRHRELQRQQLEAGERVEALEAALALASDARTPRPSELRKTAVIRLQGAAGRWDLELSYLVPGARWTPSYALWFAADYRSARLVMRASVAQRSGEDWSAARLSVSTALATRWSELPELPSRRIGRHQPVPPRAGWRPLPDDADALYADYDRAKERLPRKTLGEQVVLMSGGAVGGASAPVMTGPLDDEPEPPPPPPKPRKKRSKPRYDGLGMGAAPPPPSAAPMPARAAMPAAQMQRSRSVVGAFGDAAGAAMSALSADKPKGLQSLDAPPPTPQLAAPEDRMDYGALRLRGPDASERGRLVPVEALAVYQEVSVDVRVTTKVLRVLAKVAARAEGVGQLALPPRCADPAPIDDFDHAWEAEHPVDVASDGAWHTVTLTATEGATALSYVTVPRESTDVFRMVRFDNPLRSPLASGPVDVYVGGDFLLTTRVSAVPPGGEVNLGLGVEQAIKVARNTSFDENSRGMFGGTRSLDHEVRIEVMNTLGWPAAVEVQERVPVVDADNKDIEVVETEVTPRWSELEQQPPVAGGRRWRVTVPAGRKQELLARYAVRIASAHELRGGDRRDR
jgi:hypothetical protein